VSDPLDPSLLVEALDSLREGIQILSPEWRYLFLNDVVAVHARRPREALVGRTMMECFPGIERTEMFRELERCMRDRTAGKIENDFRYEDGTSAWFELRVRPCAAGLIVASLDLTERKVAEARVVEAHQRALRELVTPVIRIHPGVLLVPLVGNIGVARAETVTETVLSRASEENAKVVIFDIAGVPGLDTAMAHHLVQLTAMLKLLGAKAIMTGLGAATARTLVHLGVDVGAMETANHLAAGLEIALRAVGRTLVGQTG
jgi:anti-anti-sigma regulatory factor